MLDKLLFYGFKNCEIKSDKCKFSKKEIRICLY